MSLTNEEYAASGGVACPHCGHEGVTGPEVNIDEGVATQEVTCDSCDKSWTDVYQLVAYNDTGAS